MPRTKRRTGNRELFREVNERIVELWNVLDEREEPLSIVCECWRAGCLERGALPLDIYGRVRDEGNLYVVVCGHQDPERERTVEDHGGYMVVRPFEIGRRGSASALADAASVHG